MDFTNDVDVEGYLIHASFTENLPHILAANGLFPANMLDDEKKPSVGYMRKHRIFDPDSLSVCELYSHPYGYRYSLQEQSLWGAPSFHFIAVSDYPYREKSKPYSQLLSEKIDPSEYNDPWHYEGNEIALRNQGLATDTFIAFVLPTDDIIEWVSKLHRYEHIFIDSKTESRIGVNEIRKDIMDELTKNELDIPLFDLDGNRLD
jgi:hypothetical protein